MQLTFFSRINFYDMDRESLPLLLLLQAFKYRTTYHYLHLLS